MGGVLFNRRGLLPLSRAPEMNGNYERRTIEILLQVDGDNRGRSGGEIFAGVREDRMDVLLSVHPGLSLRGLAQTHIDLSATTAQAELLAIAN